MPYSFDQKDQTLTQVSAKDVVDKHDFEAFKDRINLLVDAVTEILATFKSQVDAEGVARYKLGQELERMTQDTTKTKGRLGALELGMREVRSELEQLPKPSSPERGGRGRQVRFGHGEGQELDVMQRQLTAALSEIEDLTTEVKDQAGVIKDLQGRLDGTPSRSGPRDLMAAEFASRISKRSTSNENASTDMVWILP